MSAIILKDKVTGDESFYDTFNEAINQADKGDLIRITKNFDDQNEELFDYQLEITKDIDIIFDKGVKFKRKKDSPPLIIVDENCKELITCNISGLNIEIVL